MRAERAQPRAPTNLQPALSTSARRRSGLRHITAMPPQIVKQLWVYIRAKELQDPACKRDIICDAKLKKIFAGESKVGAEEAAGRGGLGLGSCGCPRRRCASEVLTPTFPRCAAPQVTMFSMNKFIGAHIKGKVEEPEP